MNPTKMIQAILSFTLVVWLVCIGIVIGTKRTRDKVNSSPTAAPYTAVYQTVIYSVPAVTDSVPVTDITQQPLEQPTETAALAEATQAPSEAAASSEQSSAASEITDPAQAAQLYVNAVNKSKSFTDFTLTREDTLNLLIDDATGGTVAKNFANSFASSKEPHSVETLVFVGGVDQNGSGETPANAIPPITGPASVDPSALLSANAVPNEYGGYNISLALADEVQTLNAPAQNHSTMMEVIQVSELGLPSVITIIGLDIYYSGATINAVTDADGKILTMTHHLPVSRAEGSGKAIGITAQMKMHGDFTCVYTITY